MSENKQQPTAEIITPGLGDIEKVRDILFGKYVASFESRFAELENRLDADIDKLQQRLSDRFTQLDESLTQSAEAFAQKLSDEKNSRSKELNTLGKTLTEAESTLQHSISLMEDQANQDITKLQAAMELSQQEVTEHVVKVKKQLQDQLSDQTDVLENAKLGRQALALMLDEVAVKLRAND